MADRVGQQFGNYRLVALLGKGGFAEVYLGQHVRLGLQAAIKVLHTHLSDQEAAHFQQEAETIATLMHPSIVRILDYDVQAGVPFLVMDYAPNGSLRQRYPKGTVVALPQIVSYVKQVAAALQYAHEQKFVHRDVKPENMLLGRREEVLLSDFGLAAVAHSSASLSAQEALGTLPYMAPEQIDGHPRAASDQYALGVVVYEWLCGSRPFEGSVTEVTVQHLRLPPPPLRERISTISTEMEQVVMRALAKEPKERFASVQDFAVALEQASQLRPAHPRLLASEQPAPDWAAEPSYATAAVVPSQPVVPIEAIPMEPTFHLRLLGDFSLIYGDQQVTSLNTMRLQSLLAYLVLHRDVPQQRQHLAFLFWPDATEAQARNNLRQLLHQLRQALPDALHFLSADTHIVHWHPVTPFQLDVAEFEQALTLADETTRGNDQHGHPQGAPHDPTPPLSLQQAALEQADSLYRGELLPGCYDEWILPERDRLRQRHLQALEQLLRLFEVQGDTVTAIRYAQRLIGLDPLSEDLYRRLMRLFALNNDRASALHVYHTCVTTLQRELGVDPDPATREAYERLLQQEAPAIQPIVRQPLPAATPTLIGREREWEQLHVAWQHAIDGGPHFVLVTGEAGVGKSRLTEEFLLWASQQGAVTAKTRSYAAEGQLSLAPVTEWLRSEGLQAPLRQLDEVWLIEVARILPELLAERPDLPHYEPVTEYGQRQRFFEALARAILLAPQPLLLLIDDLQWCDQETLAWLHLLLRFDPTARLLVVGCAREEELPPQHPLRTFLLHLRSTMRVTEILLEPLDAAETAKLAAQVAKRELEMDEWLHLYHETGGYPLFVVEMMRADLGRGAPSLPKADRPHRQGPLEDARTLPPRMQAVLAGRLLQLSASAREFVEIAATIGREFTLDLLSTAGNADADSALHALDELWQKRIVREHGANSYDFTHDKLREVAYAEISAPQRRLLHRRVAQTLEAMHAEDLDPISGQLASHYERAGMIEQALPYYQRAAAVAQRVYANEDAISILSRSLELLELLPAGSKRDKQELSLQLALAPLYRVTKGWAAPELERVLDRALALCDTVGDDTQRAQTLYGLQSVYVVQARLERVQMVSDELHTLYQRSLGAAPSPYAGMMLAGARLHLGRITEANALFAEIIAAHDPDQILHIQESQGLNYAAHARAWQAHALWCLGYPQQALEKGLDAIKLVRDLDQPFNQALVSAYLALLQQLRADEAVAGEHAEQALALTSKYQASYYRAWADILVSYALALEQPDEEHIGRLRESVSEFKASGARLRLPYYLSLLAQIYAKAGRAEEGLAYIDEALAEARTHNERWWDSELHRLRGELLLMHGADTSDAEAAFFRAIEIARSQQARSLELRATMSLARFWITQNRSDDARGRLKDVYSWFTEGFDTPDLQAAQMLLAQL